MEGGVACCRLYHLYHDTCFQLFWTCKTFQAKNRVRAPLLVMQSLIKSSIEAMMCLLQIVTYVALEKGMENKDRLGRTMMKAL